jgi:cold shock CspA family protein
MMEYNNIKGVVSKFDNEMGIGMIQCAPADDDPCDDGPWEVDIHYSDIKTISNDGDRLLYEDDEVNFDLFVDREFNFIAKNLTVLRK